MSSEAAGSLQREGAEALRLMKEALALLDRCEADRVAAHLDFAICQLQDTIEKNTARTPPGPC